MILNLTQHPATPDQIAAGVVDLPGGWKSLLDFTVIPTVKELETRAIQVASIVPGEYREAMIGGAPFFMSILEDALLAREITPIYAFSVRESIEQSQDDGSVKKLNVFKHIGFVSPYSRVLT